MNVQIPGWGRWRRAAGLLVVLAAVHDQALSGESRAAVLGSGNVYEARVSRVIDGDTIEVTVPVWSGLQILTSIRLRGIDTPEIKGKCQSERALAKEAKAFVAALAPAGSLVKLTNVKPDKYRGRDDADVQTADGRDLAAALIAANLARPYAGAARATWCDNAPATRQ